MTDDTTEGYTPTTTHGEWGSGNPRLRVTRDGDRSEFALEADLVRIGSAEGNELRIADVDPLHATIQHDDRDEYVLTLHGEGERSAAGSADATHPGEDTQTLRTGAQFTAGDWTFVFARDESADHGRPFGGRKGGEFNDQRLQPPRPDYTDEAEQSETAETGAADSNAVQGEAAPTDYETTNDEGHKSDA